MSRRRRRRRSKRSKTESTKSPGAPPLATSALPGEKLLGHSTLRPESSWWSRRWIQAVDAFGGFGSYGKGRNQARRDQVLAFHIEPGLVLAQVQSSKPEPYIVRMDVPQIPSETWEQVISGMAQKAVFAAKLLAGEMPEEIEEAFGDSELSLLPQTAADVPATCTCGDSNTPCKHMAAVHFLLAEEVGKDPFLIFNLRGCPEEQLLSSLRLKRTGTEGEEEAPEEETPEEAPSPQAFWHAGDAIREFTINIAPPRNHGALLRQLGTPPIEEGEKFLDMISDLYKNIMSSILEDALKGQRPSE